MNSTVKNFIKYSIICGLFASLFIPFIVADSQLFPFITGKGFVFRILVEIVFALWLVGLFFDSTIRPRFSWIAASVLCFVGIVTLVDILGVNFYKSFWSNFERMDGLVTTLHVGAYFFVASSVLTTRTLWQKFLNISVVSSVIMALYALLQLSGKIVINQGGVRVDGTFGNASYLAVFMMFNFFITLILLAKSTQEKQGGINWFACVWYFLALVLQIIVTYYTATRGVILGLIGGLLLTTIIIAIFEKSRPQIRKASIAVLVLVLILIGGFVIARNSNFVKTSPTLARFASLSTQEIATQGRYYVWPMAMKGFLEKPILGWGQENFSYIFSKYYDSRMYNQEPWFDRAHNVILDWLVAGGALGLLSYLGMFAALIFLVWKNQNFSLVEKSLLSGLISAYFFQNLFIFDNLISYFYFFTVLAFVHSQSVQGKSEPVWLSRFSENKILTQRVFPGIVVVSLVLAIYCLNVRPILASRTLISALGEVNLTTIDQARGDFEKAFSYNTFGNREIAEQMFNKTQEVLSSKISDDSKRAFAVVAVEQMESQVQEFPGDTRYLLFLGSLLNRTGEFKKAVPYLEEAKKTAPKKMTSYLELGLSYLSTGEYQKSLEEFKSAFDLAPDYKESRILYAIAALYSKNDALAKELLAPIPEEVILYDERLIAAYASTGHLDVVLAFLEKRIALNPTDPVLRFRLSAGYLMLNQRAKSIEVLKKAAIDFPEHKPQADYYIKEIQAGRNP